MDDLGNGYAKQTATTMIMAVQGLLGVQRTTAIIKVSVDCILGTCMSGFNAMYGPTYQCHWMFLASRLKHNLCVKSLHVILLQS